MSGGMPASAKLLRDLAGGKIQFRAQPVQNAALADTGIAGESSQFSDQQLTKLLYAISGFCTGADLSPTVSGSALGTAGTAMNRHKILQFW